MGRSKVMVIVVVLLTPVAPDAGVVATTLGGVLKTTSTQ
jgi:hypothetical protein